VVTDSRKSFTLKEKNYGKHMLFVTYESLLVLTFLQGKIKEIVEVVNILVYKICIRKVFR